MPGAPGMRRPDAALSDDREGQDSEGWVLSYEPVHGCLKRAVRATQRRLAHAWRAGHELGDLVRERAPESRMGSARLGPLYSKLVYSQFVCFDVF